MNIQTMKQKGFTLIELVIVIVILGILAATALPKFVDLKSDATQAAVNGVAGAIGSANGINVGARAANSTKGFTTAGLACSAAAAGILTGGVPTTVTITGTVGAVGVDTACTVAPATAVTGVTNATATITGT